MFSIFLSKTFVNDIYFFSLQAIMLKRMYDMMLICENILFKLQFLSNKFNSNQLVNFESKLKEIYNFAKMLCKLQFITFGEISKNH